MRSIVFSACLLIPVVVAPAWGDEPKSLPVPAEQRGESIVVCGQNVAIGTPVILWTDPGGHNAYAPKVAPAARKADAKPASAGFGARRLAGMTPAQTADIEKTGWTLPLLQERVDQFVIHYDVCGTSKKCFEVLHERNLSVHFMLDLDGTIYQTLDLKENAYHATIANSRSIGIEIANMGAYPPADLAKSPLPRWYEPDASGKTAIHLPATAEVPTYPKSAEPLRPSRDAMVVGVVQGQELAMYDLTAQQYAALGKLVNGLCTTFPKIHQDVPRDGQGKVIDHKLDDALYSKYQGILGHFHVQANKTDPGPAFQWDSILKAGKPTTQP